MTPSEPTSALQAPPAVAVPARLLQDGEEIVLALKPSLIFILLVSMPFLSGLLVVWLAAYLLDRALPPLDLPLQTVGTFCVAAGAIRLIISIFQWVARLYVLTNRRVIRIKGVLNVEVFECPLARIQNTNLILTLTERIFGLGTIYFSTAGGIGPEAAWLTIARPREIHEIVVEYINRAQRPPTGGNPGL